LRQGGSMARRLDQVVPLGEFRVSPLHLLCQTTRLQRRLWISFPVSGPWNGENLSLQAISMGQSNLLPAVARCSSEASAGIVQATNLHRFLTGVNKVDTCALFPDSNRNREGSDVQRKIAPGDPSGEKAVADQKADELRRVNRD
jgi:hypothetical protein